MSPITDESLRPICRDRMLHRSANPAKYRLWRDLTAKQPRSRSRKGFCASRAIYACYQALANNLLAIDMKFKRQLRYKTPRSSRRISARPTATRLTICFILSHEPAKVRSRTETNAPSPRRLAWAVQEDLLTLCQHIALSPESTGFGDAVITGDKLAHCNDWKRLRRPCVRRLLF